jgi:hypothetical protein
MAKEKKLNFRLDVDVLQYLESKAGIWQVDNTKALHKIIRDYRDMIIEFQTLQRACKDAALQLEQHQDLIKALDKSTQLKTNLLGRSAHITELIRILRNEPPPHATIDR